MVRRAAPKGEYVGPKRADDPDPLRPPAFTDPDGDAYRSPLAPFLPPTGPVAKERTPVTVQGQDNPAAPAVPLEPTLPPPPLPKGRR